MMVKVNLDLRNFTPNQIKTRLGLQPGGPVQQAIDSSVIRFAMPYVPQKRGNLKQSAWTFTDIGSGEVRYGEEYAHYMYEGIVYGPNFPVEFNAMGQPIDWRTYKGIEKYPTNRHIKYKKDLNPKAGDHWIDRMKVDRIDDIVKEAVKKLGQ